MKRPSNARAQTYTSILGPLAVLAAPVLLAFVGCETVTREKTDYNIRDSKASSILDNQLKRFEEEAAKYPKVPDYHYKIAAIHFERGEYRESIASLEKAIDLAPENAKYHYQLGRTYMTINEVALAEQHFRETVELCPPKRYTGPHAALALALAKQKRWQEAIAEVKECIEIEPGDPLSYYYLGVLCDITNDGDGAIRNLREYLARGGGEYNEKALTVLKARGVDVESIELLESPPPRRDDPLLEGV